MPPTVVDTGKAQREDIFESARNSFLESLSASDRLLFSPCTTSTDFLDALKTLELTTQRYSSSAKLFRPVRGLAENLRPFFDVVNIFVQSNPEFSAIFWGAFRLVLQLSSNLCSFFEQLLVLISQLLDVFPRYEDVVKLCNDENSGRIRRNIGEVYVDMLEIFKAAVKVFTKSTGKLKRTPVVVGTLLWRPFDVKFKQLLDKMAIHKYNIDEEIKIWKLRNEENQHDLTAKWREYIQKESEEERHLAHEERRLMAEERKSMETERSRNTAAQQKIASLLFGIKEEKEQLEAHHLEDTVRRIQEWLKPSDHCNARQMNAKVRQRHKSTATWIFDHTQYQSWMKSDEESYLGGGARMFGSNMLWMHGHPGSGKTVLATSILDELENQDNLPEDTSPIILYHFFQFESQYTRSPAAAYRSLLAQFIWKYRNSKDIVDKFVFIMTAKSQGQTDASEQSLLDLLRICFDKRVYVILDGVDECENSDSFTKALLDVSLACSHKTLILSRINMPHLQRSVPLEVRLPLPKADISRDIYRFCQSELEDMVLDGFLPHSTLDDLPQLASHLVNGADGMFLWARLMMTYLRLPTLSQTRRVETITEIHFPEGLEYMYNRIFSVIVKSGPTTVKLAAHVFMWLSHRTTSMTTYQTRQAFSVDGKWSRDNNGEEIGEFESAAVMACRGLVEISPITRGPSTRRVLKFIHLTVREIFSRSDADPAWHSSSMFDKFRDIAQPTIANLKLGRSCLRQLVYHTPEGPLSGKISESISSEKLSHYFPFTDYAALYWMNHLEASIPSSYGDSVQLDSDYKDAFDDFVSDLQTFLENPRTVTAWLEAYYSAQHYVSPRGSMIRHWASWVSEQAQQNTLKIKGVVLGLAFEFRTDLDRIVKVWNRNLTISPHIMWDEVTTDGLAPSRLFFSSGSTRFKSRAPEKLDMEGIADAPIGSTSTVSNDGSLLGVLSIWPEKSFKLSDYQSSRQQALSSRYDRLASSRPRPKVLTRSWVALYELWPLDLDRPRLARIVVNMANDLISYVTSSENPLSISPDCLSFSVTYQIWRLTSPQSSETINFAECEWPSPVPYETARLQIKPLRRAHDHDIHVDETWSSLQSWSIDLNVAFNPTGQYIMLTERYWDVNSIEIGSETRISTFEMTSTPIIEVKSLNVFEIGKDTQIIQQIFHPTLHICALLFTHQTQQRGASLHLWNFGTGSNELRQIGFVEQPCDAIQFSACGSYILSKITSTGVMNVIPIPEGNSQEKDIESGIPLPDIAPRREHDAESIVPFNEADIRLRLQSLGSGRMIRGFSATTTDDDIVTASSNISGNRVQLNIHRRESPHADVMQLATLPGWNEFSKSTAEIKLPQSDKDSTKIILHKANASGYGGAQLPIVIERDPKFFSRPQACLPDADRATSNGFEEGFGENLDS